MDNQHKQEEHRKMHARHENEKRDMNSRHENEIASAMPIAAGPENPPIPSPGPAQPLTPAPGGQ